MLYVCITFAELKRLDILWGDKLLWTSCIKIDTALKKKKADWEANQRKQKEEQQKIYKVQCMISCKNQY